MLIYAPDHFGRHGFRRPQAMLERPTSINVGQLAEFLPYLRTRGAVTERDGSFVADLAKAGIDRLLGAGAPRGTWSVYVAHASRHAGEKVTLLTEPPREAPGAT
jgi:large subunit ribosomal protein L15